VSLPTPTQRFFGGLLMGVGGLMMGLCGACSTLAIVLLLPGLITMIGGLLSGQRSEVDSYTEVFFQSFVLFGVIPILVGWGLFLLGRRMRGEFPRPTAKSIWPPPGDAP
jgi:hypothetical protein